MNKEDLLQFLRENLTIEIEKESTFYSDDHPSFTISLKLEDEVISCDSLRV